MQMFIKLTPQRAGAFLAASLFRNSTSKCSITTDSQQSTGINSSTAVSTWLPRVLLMQALQATSNFNNTSAEITNINQVDNLI